jgi:membrane protease subunit (stomatin/prohibitin family)
MGILDFLTGEFIDVIEWTDDTRDTMVWEMPSPSGLRTTTAPVSLVTIYRAMTWRLLSHSPTN